MDEEYIKFKDLYVMVKLVILAAFVTGVGIHSYPSAWRITSEDIQSPYHQLCRIVVLFRLHLAIFQILQDGQRKCQVSFRML